MSNGDEAVEVQGTRVPVLGFGTWLIEGADATEAVRDALEIGYRQIDAARAYGNEREVGRGIADSGVAREEIFLTTTTSTCCCSTGRARTCRSRRR
jgi:2,5-diketo-D-gluconate reductase B